MALEWIPTLKKFRGNSEAAFVIEDFCESVLIC